MENTRRSLKEGDIISVAAPVYNESAGIESFVTEVLEALASLDIGCDHELILVDDGSTDGTSEILEVLAAAYSDRLRVIRLSRNFGLCAAVTAALRNAEGDVVILMDADMQDDPRSFGRFLEKWEEGYDVVYAVRTGRRDSTVIRVLSWGFYRVLSFMAQISLPLDAGAFALMDRRVVKSLATLPENNRYLPGLRSWVGFRQVGLPVERRERRHGSSRMGLRRLYDLALMALFSFSFMPLFIFRLIGAGAITIAFILMLLCPPLVLAGVMPWAAALTLFSIALFSGINLLGISILGEYVALIYDEVRNRPLYIVERMLGRERGGEPEQDA